MKNYEIRLHKKESCIVAEGLDYQTAADFGKFSVTMPSPEVEGMPIALRCAYLAGAKARDYCRRKGISLFDVDLIVDEGIQPEIAYRVIDALIPNPLRLKRKS